MPWLGATPSKKTAGVRRVRSTCVDEPLHPVQIEGFKRMTPAQKLQMVCELYEAGIQLRVAGLRVAHPDWPEQRRVWRRRLWQERLWTWRRRLKVSGGAGWWKRDSRACAPHKPTQ